MNAVEILQSHQLKKTSPRVAIVQALQESLLPLSENEVKAKMGDQYDRITFYRSVQTLLEAGIIHKIVADNVTVKYALNRCDDEHHHEADHLHFFCRQCNSLECLNEIKIQRYGLPKGYVADECNVIIKGLCNKCNTSGVVGE
ncbi:MAG TPA: transcriptional repressor [Bacteroidales bacterium]|nr:transcriptional repressor [Bacteroidales bacterium]